MESDTGWSRAAGESTGRWRTILARASGRASVPTQVSPESGSPEDEAGLPAYDPPAYRTPYEPARFDGHMGYDGHGGHDGRASYEPPPAYDPPPAYEPPAYDLPRYDPLSSGYAGPASSPAAAPPPPPLPAAPSPPLPTPMSPARAPLPEATIPTQRPSVSAIEWRTAPGAAVTPLDQAMGMLRRDLGGSKVIAFANPKGGVHKTTATVLAAATIGSVRGRGVVAWDDNELRGTLGLRAGSARHARTIRHLVTELAEVELHTGAALAERLDDFLRHASDGSYDVLAGEEDSRFAWKLDPQTVRRVLDLLTRTHEVICVDTGNNVESANWQTVMQSADQLVITTVPREDSAFTADWMMDILIEGGLHELVENAVTLLSLPTPRPSPMVNDLARHFATRTRAVAIVPYDPSLEAGASIEYSSLTPETRQAWLEAAASIMIPHVR